MKRSLIIVLILTATILLIINLIIKNPEPQSQNQSRSKKIIRIEDIKDMPLRTGGTKPQPIPTDVSQGKAINQLLKSLPFTANGFTITRYDYRQGKFIVSGNRQELFHWLENSEFTPIPLTMFAWE
jgi:hypothetical protein